MAFVFSVLTEPGNENGARGEAAKSVARKRADPLSNVCNTYARVMKPVDSQDSRRKIP